MSSRNLLLLGYLTCLALLFVAFLVLNPAYYTPVVSWSPGLTLLSNASTLPLTPPPRKQLPLHDCHKANMTIMSALFDFGNHKRKVDDYLAMSQAFAYIHTPLVFYTDSDRFADHLRKVRQRLPATLTHVFKVNRSELWAFGLEPTVAALYSRQDYAKHYPNTIVPYYSCAMHAKFDLMLDLILNKRQIQAADVYAWVDFGYYRDLRDAKEYCLLLPKFFSSQKVTYNQVYTPNFNVPARDIYYGNHVWVGGGMFVASRGTMVRFCVEYRRSVEYWLFQRNLSSTDQQNIYASLTTEGQREVKFSVPIHVEPGNHGWFHLGMSCLHRLDNNTVQQVDAVYLQ